MSDAHADHDLSKPDPRVEGWGGNDDAPELSAEQAAALQQREEPVAAADFGLPLTGDLGRAEVASRASTPPRPPSRTRAWVTRAASGTRTTPTGRAAPPDAAGVRGLTLPGTRPGGGPAAGAGDHPRRVRWTGARPGEGRCGPVRRRGRTGPPASARPTTGGSHATRTRSSRCPLPGRGPHGAVVRRRGAGRRPGCRWSWRDAAAPAPPRSRRAACRRPRPPPARHRHQPRRRGRRPSGPRACAQRSQAGRPPSGRR